MRYQLTTRLWSRILRLLINNERVTETATAINHETVVKTLMAMNHNEISLNNGTGVMILMAIN